MFTKSFQSRFYGEINLRFSLCRTKRLVVREKSFADVIARTTRRRQIIFDFDSLCVHDDNYSVFSYGFDSKRPKKKKAKFAEGLKNVRFRVTTTTGRVDSERPCAFWIRRTKSPSTVCSRSVCEHSRKVFLATQERYDQAYRLRAIRLRTSDSTASAIVTTSVIA